MASATNDVRRDVLDGVHALSEYSRQLPSFAAEKYAEETTAHIERILSLLAVDAVPPHSGQVSEALHRLKAFYEQRYEPSADHMVSIAIALWRLLVLCAPGQVAPYGYSMRERLASTLRKQLQRINSKLMVPLWMDSPAREAENAALMKRLSSELDPRVLVHMLMEEIGTSFRVDRGVANGAIRHMVINFMELCTVLRRFVDKSAGESIVYGLSKQLDERYCDAILYARMIVVLMPKACAPKILRNGDLWSWWSTLPEGLVPKFDLQWFAVLGRYAKLRWMSHVDLGEDGSTEADCDLQVKKHLPWLLNKVCLTLQLPLCAPSASEGTKDIQSLPRLEMYHLPPGIDCFMGGITTWKRVAKFIVYMLSSEPPATPADAISEGSLEISADDAWSWLALLLRRMNPFLQTGSGFGTYTWHCMTLLEHVVKAYFKRVGRERLLPCNVPADRRLSRAADERFVKLLLPVVNNCLQSMQPQIMFASLEMMSELSQLSAMHSPPADDPSVLKDKFTVSMPTILSRATEALNDPTMSMKSTILLQLFVSSLPGVLLRYPAALSEVFPVVLLGIDATDLAKSLSALTLIMRICTYVPYIDVNDWPELPQAAASGLKQTRWPAPGERDPSCDEASLVWGLSSMLPAFVEDYFDRVCEFMAAIPKTSKKSGHAIENLVVSLLHSATYLVMAHSDASTFKRILDRLTEFMTTTLMVDQVKPASAFAAAIVRANPDVAVPVVLPPLVKKLLPRFSPPARGSTTAVPPMHELGLSDSEAVWSLHLLAGVVRHSGEALLTFQTELETVIQSALMDEREAVVKLGAKLLRRILFSLTATYARSDFRCCSDGAWKKLMAARVGSGEGGKAEDVWPLKWWGWTEPWWESESPSVCWHVPSEREVEWAQSLVRGTLSKVSSFLSFQPAGDVPMVEGWLVNVKSPVKKKASHSIYLGILLARAVLRGVAHLWPDERTPAEVEAARVPALASSATADMGAEIFNCLADLLIAAVKALAPQERLLPELVGEAPAKAALPGIDHVEVPKILGKVVKCIGELMQTTVTHSPARLLPPGLFGHRGHGPMGMAIGLEKTPIDGLHLHAKWRSQPRLWWVLTVCGIWDARRHARCTGYEYAGRRKVLIDSLAELAMNAGFQPVRHRSLSVMQHVSAYHKGVKWPLVQNHILPALKVETEAASLRGNFIGKAADSEQQRLNNALEGISHVIVAGRSLNLLWRRGAQDAALLGLALCECIYAATKSMPAAAARPDAEKVCEVKTTTVAQLIAGVHHLIERREMHCSGSVKLSISDADFDTPEFKDCPQRGLRALELMGKMLDICERSDCHWRAQVMATVMSMAVWFALGQFVATVEKDPSVRALAERWAIWLMKCCDPKNQPTMHDLGTHGLLFLLKRASPLGIADLEALGLFKPEFFEKLFSVLPQLDHEQVINNGGGGGGSSDPTSGPVGIITEIGSIKVWRDVWTNTSAAHTFSIGNALFWQTYVVGLVRSSGAAENLPILLEKVATSFVEKPVGEAEYHLAFTEFCSGVLRALRRSSTKAHLATAWNILYPHIRSETQKASQERLSEWCDAFRFIVAGSSRPVVRGYLRSLSSKNDAEEAVGKASADINSIVALFNFALNPDQQPSIDSLQQEITLIKIGGDATAGSSATSESSSAEKEESSFGVYKRLRLLMALIVEPGTTPILEGDARFGHSLFEALRAGLGHPYKQLREEAARSLFLMVRAAGHRGGNGLGGVAAAVETWLAEEAERLVPLMRAESGKEKSATRSSVVLESTGVCYVLLHASIERLASRLLGHTVPRCIEFLITAATHDDFELRVLAQQALALCSASHAVSPVLQGDRPWGDVASARAVARLLQGSDGACVLSNKEREKAIFMAARPMLLTNVFTMNVPQGGVAGNLFQDLRSMVESSLGHSESDVRNLAKTTLISILPLDTEGSVKKYVKRCNAQAKAGTTAMQDGSASAEITEKMNAGILGLSCALQVAAELGGPNWVGLAIERLAQYGGKSAGSVAKKEVQGSFSHFLKLQQATQQSWQDCQEKLTTKQKDLLKEYKGGLDYFS